MRYTLFSFALLAAMIPQLIGGCTINLSPADGTTGGGNGSGDNSGATDQSAGVGSLAAAVSIVQTADPRAAALPDALLNQGDTLVLDADVNVIVNIDADLPGIDLPDSTVVGFDNQTGLDLYVRFLADGALQGVYVYDGETLLLDYPCLSEIELLSEDDIDPFTGVVVDSFNLYGTFDNPDDFICGDAVILPFESDTADITVEYINLED